LLYCGLKDVVSLNRGNAILTSVLDKGENRVG